MSGFYASVNGQLATRLSIAIPYYGMWEGDVELATPQVITNPVTLVIGNLTMVGAIVRANTFAGVTYLRLVGGGGGWRKSIVPQAYANPSGVRLSTMLNDLAVNVGEQVNLFADENLGGYFIREGSTSETTVRASRILRQLAGDEWWIDTSGVTQVGARPTGTAITSDFSVVSWDPGRGAAEIATEDLASWLPSNTFTAPTVPVTQTISLTRVDIDRVGTMRLKILATDPDTLDRLNSPFGALVVAELPQLTFYGTYEYSIQRVSGSTVDVAPTDTTISLPSITGLLMKPGLLGETVTPTVGSTCRVAFVNGQPSRPCVEGIDPRPQSSTIDATKQVSIGPSASLVALAGGSGAVALAQQTDTNFTKIVQAIITAGNVASGTETGFKALVEALLALYPSPSVPPSTAAANVTAS